VTKFSGALCTYLMKLFKGIIFIESAIIKREKIGRCLGYEKVGQLKQ